MKTRTLLIAAVMFLGLTAAAFAQATYQVGSIPVTAVINTGLTERTGDITFTQISGTSVQGTITISYGVPITGPSDSIFLTAPPNSGTGAAGYGTLVNAPAQFVAGTTISSVTINSINNSAGVLVLSVPSGVNVTGQSFTVSGVRVNVAGTTLSNLTASLSSTNNAIVAGQTSVVVVSSIAPGIASVTVSSSRRAVINAATGAITTNGVANATPSSRIDVKEGFLNAYNDINPNNNYGVGVRFTLTAPPPPGISITFPASATTDSTQAAGIPIFVAVDGTAPTSTVTPGAITSSSTNLSVFYRLTTISDPTFLETIKFPITITFSGSSNLPIPSGSIQFTTTLFPIGTAFDADGKVIPTQALIPRYVESLIGPTTLATISSATTALLVPFAQRISSVNYDTGFAVANTTEDPGSSALGAGLTGAVPQSGAITFYFFPQLPTPGGTNPTNSSYTTSGTSPGTGLDANGRVPAGSTYTVLLSQLLQAAGLPADFAGYVIIVTNFTDAHCLFVVSNFTTFSQGSLALVMTGDRSAGTEALNQ